MNQVFKKRASISLILSLYIISSINSLSNTDIRSIQNSTPDMSTLSLRQFLLQGGKSYGPLLMSDSSIIAEIIAMSGYGHVVIDHEHSMTNVHSYNGQQSILQAIDAAAAMSWSRYRNDHLNNNENVNSNNKQQLRRITEPIIRIPGPNDPVYIKKVLDTLKLPGGILVPMVEDAETAYKIVQATRYPLQQQQQHGSDINSYNGVRGCAIPFIRATSYGMMDQETYLQQCNDDLLVMVQVESRNAITTISDIASIDGVDAIFLGPFDISTSIGKMGQFTDPEFVTLMEKAERDILSSNNCLLAGFKPPNQSIQAMFEKGYSLVCGSVDLGLIKDAARIDAKKGHDAILKSSRNHQEHDQSNTSG